jgi:biotin carboxyl carrier protein
MKMENEIRAETSGDIIELKVQVGDTVSAGSPIMIIR